MTELGIRLKEAREEKAMSLDDLQAATKIQKRYLTALEEGNYDIIPGKFYVRAFIKQYAEAVGLDADQLFEEHKKDIPNTYHDDVSEKISGMNLQKEMPKPASKALEASNNTCYSRRDCRDCHCVRDHSICQSQKQ